jgi:SARP family transcriptional regulator, regulator of embCAB operon
MVQDKDVPFQLNLFQCWQLWQGQTEVQVAWRQQRVITALAISGPRPRRYLSGLLWPDSTEARAMESLRVSLHLISHQIPGLLVSGGSVLSLRDGVKVDLHQLLEHVKTCEQSPSDSAEATCLARLRGAELLPGWYEDWVVLEQHRLRNIRMRALAVLSRRWLDRGDADRAIEAAEAALELEPLHEGCLGLLMAAELKMGNRMAALRAFENFRSHLEVELGVAPSEHLVELARAMQ